MTILVVEDGTVVAGANSYVSVAEADAYLESNLSAYPTWIAFDVGDKGSLLQWATRYLDQRARWYGTKTDADSALRWPRSGVYDRDSNLIDDDTMPSQLKVAVIEMARYLMISDRAIERGTDGIVRLKVDVIELEFDKDYRLAEIPNELHILIAGLGVLNSGGFPRFPKILKA